MMRMLVLRSAFEFDGGRCGGCRCRCGYSVGRGVYGNSISCGGGGIGTGCYSDNGNSRGGDRGNGGIGSGGCSVYGSSGGGYRRNGRKRGRNKSARLLVQWFW